MDRKQEKLLNCFTRPCGDAALISTFTVTFAIGFLTNWLITSSAICSSRARAVAAFISTVPWNGFILGLLGEACAVGVAGE